MMRFLALAGALGMISPAFAQTSAAPATRQATTQRPAAQLPPAQTLVILIRSTAIAVSHANVTNNYSVLYGLGSPGFRTANSPEKLQSLFASFRANKIDLNPVALLTPQLSFQPVIENGRLRLVGFFPSQPMRVNYDFSFEQIGSSWQIGALAINLVAAPPPAANPASKPGQKPEAKPKRQ